MTHQTDLAELVSKIDADSIDAVRSHLAHSKTASDPIFRFDSLSKGWDRLASEIWPDDSIGYRFRRLTSLCTSVSWSPAIDSLLLEVGAPIRNELERLEKDAQRDFDRAKKNLLLHRKNRLDDSTLMESIGTLLWAIRSNSMHGRKTASGPIGPTNRDEQVCGLGADVLLVLYNAVFEDQ